MPPQLGPGAFGFGHPLTMVAVQVAMIQPMSMMFSIETVSGATPDRSTVHAESCSKSVLPSTTNLQIQQQSKS